MAAGTTIPVTAFSSYDMFAVVPICNLEISQHVGGMQFFSDVANQTVELSSICVKTNRPEVQARQLSFLPGLGIRAGGGYRYDYFDSGANDMACVPYKIYGIEL